MRVEQPPNWELPPKRALILGSGRCGTFHVSRMFAILFSEYVWATHEHPPNYAPEVAALYDNWEFTSNRALRLSRLKWRALMSRWHIEDHPVHRWVDCSTFNVPFIYHLCKLDPELKIIIMIRHPEGFVRSCNSLLHMESYSGKPNGFVWDRLKHKRWAGNPAQYWKECYLSLHDQLRWLWREPDLVMFLDGYREGVYLKRLLRLFDIPETQQNLERAKWFCSQRAVNQTRNREVWKSTEIPESLEYCKPIWDWWEETYAWMAEEE